MGETIHERTAAEPARVDREKGVVEGVKLLGRVSQNGRRYSTAALEQAAQLYKGSKVNFDHADSPGGARKVAEGIGMISRAWFDADRDGVFGDVDYLLETEHGRQFGEIAERMPGLIGMSHDVEAELRESEDGVKEVASITSVSSVDAVDRPATTKTLFESENQQVKLREYAEALPSDDALRPALLEASKVLEGRTVDKGAAAKDVLASLFKSEPKPEPTVESKSDAVFEALSKTVEELAAWKRDVIRKQDAIAVLERNEVDPRPQLIEELQSLDDRKAMQERVDLWPDYVKRPQHRPRIESNVTEQESVSGDYETFSKRLGIVA